jgi:hypothetical protein
MGAGNTRIAGQGGVQAAGDKAMQEALMRQRAQQGMENMSRHQNESPVGGMGAPGGYRPGLEPDYQNMAEDARLRATANSGGNIGSGRPPLRGGMIMAPGRAARLSDEDVQELERRVSGAR